MNFQDFERLKKVLISLELAKKDFSSTMGYKELFPEILEALIILMKDKVAAK